jgi:hypothetical protein
MTMNGQEVDIQEIDNYGSTVEVFDTIRDYEIKTRFKRYRIRIKVDNKQDETTQYLMWSDLVARKRADGRLFIRDINPDTQPAFEIEYRKNMPQGYYVIWQYCEIV